LGACRVFVALLLIVGVGSCAEGNDGTDSKPGNPAVYQRIEAESDCSALQREFDTAMDNFDRAEPGSDARKWSLAYAEAAEKRRQQLSC
jgi:hypothetical protein